MPLKTAGVPARLPAKPMSCLACPQIVSLLQNGGRLEVPPRAQLPGGDDTAAFAGGRRRREGVGGGWCRAGCPERAGRPAHAVTPLRSHDWMPQA